MGPSNHVTVPLARREKSADTTAGITTTFSPLSALNAHTRAQTAPVRAHIYEKLIDRRPRADCAYLRRNSDRVYTGRGRIAFDTHTLFTTGARAAIKAPFFRRPLSGRAPLGRAQL